MITNAKNTPGTSGAIGLLIATFLCCCFALAAAGVWTHQNGISGRLWHVTSGGVNSQFCASNESSMACRELNAARAFVILAIFFSFCAVVVGFIDCCVGCCCAPFGTPLGYYWTSRNFGAPFYHFGVLFLLAAIMSLIAFPLGYKALKDLSYVPPELGGDNYTRWDYGLAFCVIGCAVAFIASILYFACFPAIFAVHKEMIAPIPGAVGVPVAGPMVGPVSPRLLANHQGMVPVDSSHHHHQEVVAAAPVASSTYNTYPAANSGAVINPGSPPVLAQGVENV